MKITVVAARNPSSFQQAATWPSGSHALVRTLSGAYDRFTQPVRGESRATGDLRRQVVEPVEDGCLVAHAEVQGGHRVGADVATQLVPE